MRFQPRFVWFQILIFFDYAKYKQIQKRVISNSQTSPAHDFQHVQGIGMVLGLVWAAENFHKSYSLFLAGGHLAVYPSLENLFDTTIYPPPLLPKMMMPYDLHCVYTYTHVHTHTHTHSLSLSHSFLALLYT